MALAEVLGDFQALPEFPVINGGSTAILYCFVFLYFAASGPGPWAINQK